MASCGMRGGAGSNLVLIIGTGRPLIIVVLEILGNTILEHLSNYHPCFLDWEFHLIIESVF